MYGRLVRQHVPRHTESEDRQMKTAERVALQREAYIAGVRSNARAWSAAKERAARNKATEVYPIPMVEVPVTVWVGRVQYQVHRGVMMFRVPDRFCNWRPLKDMTPAKVRLLLHLFDQPTELVACQD